MESALCCLSSAETPPVISPYSYLEHLLEKRGEKAVRINAATYLSKIPLGSIAGTALNVNINETCSNSKAVLTLQKIGAMKQLVQDLVAQERSKSIETAGIHQSEIALVVPLAKCGTVIGFQGSVA